MNRKGAVVFGMTDGLTLVLGLFLGLILSMQSNNALWHAALGGGLAELGGMSLGQYWSDPDKDKVGAAFNGVGCCLATVVAALPFAFLAREAAVALSSVIIFLMAVIICILREERGKVAVVRTFGLLVIAGAMSGVSGLI